MGTYKVWLRMTSYRVVTIDAEDEFDAFDLVDFDPAAHWSHAEDAADYEITVDDVVGIDE